MSTITTEGKIVPADDGRTYGDQTDPEEGMARVHSDSLYGYTDALVELISITHTHLGEGDLDEDAGWVRLGRYAAALCDTARLMEDCRMKDATLRLNRERAERTGTPSSGAAR